jgi:hypothetical protein
LFKGKISQFTKIQAFSKFSSNLLNCLASGREKTHQGQIEIMIVKSVKIVGIIIKFFFFENIK